MKFFELTAAVSFQDSNVTAYAVIPHRGRRIRAI